MSVLYTKYCSEIEQLRPKSPNRPDRTNHQTSSPPNPSHGRMGNSTPQMQNMMPNQQMQMMHGGMHHMQAGPGPMGVPGFGAPNMPMMGASFNPNFQQGDGMMVLQPMMGMVHSPMGGMRVSLPANPMQAPMMGGAPMNPMGMSAPMLIPQNAPIRLGGGPMQNLQIPNGMGMQGAPYLAHAPSPMGMGGLQMGMQTMQMNPMNQMHPNMVPGPNGMQFVNPNRNWQPNNPQGWNWNQNQNQNQNH